jgi:hypothetical protein
VSIYDEPAPYVRPGAQRTRRTLNAVATVVIVVVVGVASVMIVKAGTDALLGQCAPTWLSGTDPQLCLNARISRRTLVVSGSTSLPDGAVVQVWAEDFGTAYNEHWNTDTVDLTVVGGSFGRGFDLSDWGAGTVTVTAFFEIGSKQPAEVIDRYGANGERLAGPEVKLDMYGGDPPPRAVQVSTDVDLSAA